MPLYNVKWYLEYEVEARNKSDAIELTEGLMVEELENNHFGLTEIFGFEVSDRMNPYEISIENFPDDGITSADLEEDFLKFALMLASGKYDFYTQVDGDNGESVYLHGVHKVNKTGVYALIPKGVK